MTSLLLTSSLALLATVSVRPVDPQSGTAPVAVTFPLVVTEGETTLQLRPSGPAPWPGHQTGTPPLFYELATTTAYEASPDDPVSICIDYSGQSFMAEHRVVLVQLVDPGDGTTGPAWADRTAMRDAATHTLCANATDLGTFALVEPTNSAPLVDAGPDQTAVTNDEAVVTLNGAATIDPDGDPLELEWTDDAGGVVATTASARVTLAPGGHLFTLTARDPRGGVAGDTVAVTVTANRPPSVTLPAETRCHPTPSTPCEVVVVASATDPDGDALTFTWSGCTPTAPGEATCTVTDLSARPVGVVVSDGYGGEASAQGTVVGYNSPPACWAGVSSLCGAPYCGLMVPFGKTDPDGDALTQQCPGADTIWPSGACRFPGQESGSSNYGGAVVSDPWGATASCGANLRWHGACWRCDG